ncbi:metallophosphoesterase [Cystobacter fuscus]
MLHVPGMHREHDGLRIAHLSDIHVGQATSAVRIRRAVAEVNAREPDVIFLTGDYVTHSPKPLPRVIELLAGFTRPVFAVLGNHDHWVDAHYLRTGFERLGYTVLQNEHRVVQVRGAPLTVLGIDDGRTHRDDVEATFRGRPSPARDWCSRTRRPPSRSCPRMAIWCSSPDTRTAGSSWCEGSRRPSSGARASRTSRATTTCVAINCT